MAGKNRRQFDKILKLIDGGQEEKAYELLKDLLIQNPDDADAWQLMLELAPNEKEREFANLRLKQFSQPDQQQRTQSQRSRNTEQTFSPKTPPGWEEREINQALELISDKKNKQAKEIVDEVLRKSPTFPAAVYAKGLLSTSVIDYRNALAELAELSKRDRNAKSYYEGLADWKPPEKRRLNLGFLRTVAGVMALFVALIGISVALPYLPRILGSGGENDGGILADVAATDELRCEELIASALNVSDKRCSAIGTNQVCYGNYHLDADYEGAVEAFNEAGDVLEIRALRSLVASPLNLIEELWGVAVFKMRATIEGTIPGQNVIFLVFGNTEIENESGDMTAFYFSTGFGGIKCHGVDFDGLTIEMPDGYEFVFTANDVLITLSGEALMSAEPGGEMAVTLVTGSAEVTSDGVTRVLVPGTSVTIPIDENLSASGPPSEVMPVSGGQASLLCQLYGLNCPPGEISVIFGPMTPAPGSTEVAVVIPPDTPSGENENGDDDPPDSEVPAITEPVEIPEAVCNQIVARFTSYGKFKIVNNSGSPVVLTGMTLTAWPDINGRWEKVFVGKVIGSPNADTPPATHYFSGHLTERTFNAGVSKTLRVDFTNGALGGGYIATFYFDNGCARLARN